MTMLAYYAEVNWLYLRYLPVLPYYSEYIWRKPFCDLKAHQPGGKFTGGGHFLSTDLYYTQLPNKEKEDSLQYGLISPPLASITTPAAIYTIPVDLILPSSLVDKMKAKDPTAESALTTLATAAGIQGKDIIKCLSKYFFPKGSSTKPTDVMTLNLTSTYNVIVYLVKDSVPSPSTPIVENAFNWSPDLQIYRQPVVEEIDGSNPSANLGPTSVKIVLHVGGSKVNALPWPLSLTTPSDSAIKQGLNPISIFSTFDPGSYGQALGGTHRKRGRDKGFLDTSHIVGQSKLLSNCIAEMLCMNVSRPTRTQLLDGASVPIGTTSGTGGGTGTIGQIDSHSHGVNHCFTAPFVRCGIDLQYTPLINLHIHSKNVDRFVSMRCPCP